VWLTRAIPTFAFTTKFLAHLCRNRYSEYLAQSRKGRKEKSYSELGALGVLAGANHLSFVLFGPFVVTTRPHYSWKNPDLSFTPIEKLLQAVAAVHGCEGKVPLAGGQQLRLAMPRAQLAYPARYWCALKATEIARRFERDPSMFNQLCRIYESARHPSMERIIASVKDT